MSRHATAYRAIVREVNRASIHPRPLRPKTVYQHVRAIFEDSANTQDEGRFHYDMRNAATFMSSQRMHKVLLERYNPLLGLSKEDHMKRTANRVGLNMPLGLKDEE